MGGDEPRKISVSKLDAAKRQLDAAIRLWFADGDPVSIHTLVGAAYQIIHDVNKARGRKDVIFDGTFIKDEFREKARAWLRKDFNFFKHANNDPDGITEFVPLGSLLFILAGMQTLLELGESPSDVQNAFGMYMAFTKPEYINDQYVAALKAKSPPNYGDILKSLNKDEFLRASLEAAGLLRAQGKLR